MAENDAGGPWELRGRAAALADYARNAGVEIALGVLGIVSGVLVARGLGPEGRGQLTAAMMWPTVIGALVSVGLIHAFSYAAGAGWASPERLHRLARRYSLAVGVPTAVVYWFLCPFIFVKQFPDDPWIPRFFALSIPLTLYAGLLLPIFQGAGDFRRWNIGRLLRGGVWALLVVALALSARLSVPVLLLVQLGIYALMIAYLAPMVGRLPAPEPEEDPAGSMGRIFRYGWAIFLSGIAYMVNQQLDQLLLSLWVSPAELGQYAAAVTLSGALLLVPAAVGPIVFSRMARSADEPSRQWLHQRQALLLTAVLLVPSGLCLAALGPFVTVLVYGAAFERAGEVLRILAPATVFLGVAHTLGDVLRGAGRPMDTTYGFTAGAVLTIGGLAWALPRFGIMGAAWVSFFAYCAMMAVQLHLLRRWKTKQVQTAPSPTIP